MKNFIFKSADADLQKMFQLIVTIQKNVLYITHRVDLIIRELNEIKTDKGLQKQVDEYFAEDSEETPPEDTTQDGSD